MDTFGLRIIASDKVFFNGRCKKLTIPAPDGEKGVLAHHENMVIAVVVGIARMESTEGEVTEIAVGTGFAEIVNNRVTLLVDTAERPEDIDVRHAREQREHAQERMRQKQSIQEYYHTQASLARAMNRLKPFTAFKGEFKDPMGVDRKAEFGNIVNGESNSAAENMGTRQRRIYSRILAASSMIGVFGV